jgi:hypothetical protein
MSGKKVTKKSELVLVGCSLVVDGKKFGPGDKVPTELVTENAWLAKRLVSASEFEKLFGKGKAAR